MCMETAPGCIFSFVKPFFINFFSFVFHPAVTFSKVEISFCPSCPLQCLPFQTTLNKCITTCYILSSVTGSVRGLHFVILSLYSCYKGKKTSNLKKTLSPIHSIAKRYGKE